MRALPAVCMAMRLITGLPHDDCGGVKSKDPGAQFSTLPRPNRRSCARAPGLRSRHPRSGSVPHRNRDNWNPGRRLPHRIYRTPIPASLFLLIHESKRRAVSTPQPPVHSAAVLSSSPCFPCRALSTAPARKRNASVPVAFMLLFSTEQARRIHVSTPSRGSIQTCRMNQNTSTISSTNDSCMAQPPLPVS